MDFKEGDKVKICTKEEFLQILGFNNNQIEIPFSYNDRKEYLGKETTILKIKGHFASVGIDHRLYAWDTKYLTLIDDMDSKTRLINKWKFKDNNFSRLVEQTLLKDGKIKQDLYLEKDRKNDIIKLENLGWVNLDYIELIKSYEVPVDGKQLTKEIEKDQDKRFELVQSIIQGFCANPNHEIFIYEEDPDGFEGEDPKINDFIIDKAIEIADKILEKLK